MNADYTLMPSQKNEILGLIKGAGAPLIKFQLSVVPSQVSENTIVSMLQYVGSDYYFIFDVRNGLPFSIFSPGPEKIVQHEYPGAWKGQRAYFGNWLGYLNREIEQPDLWAEIAKYQIPHTTETISDISDEPFSEPQITQITSALNQILVYVKSNVVLSEQQTNFVVAHFAYLENAVKRQGRRDWLYTCIGVLVTIATGLTLAPQQARTIWDFIKDAINLTFQLLPQLR